MALTTSLNLSIQATATGTAGPLGNTPTDQIVATITDSLASGTGLDSADLYYAPAAYTITTGSQADIDLSSAGLNGLGQTVAFVKIKGILIHNTTATAGFNVTV